MSPDDLRDSIESDDEPELAAVVFARDTEEAQRYCELLADHGIVGIVSNEGVELEDAEVRGDSGEGVAMTRGVAVLVEDTMLDEAGLVISDRQNLTEFQFDQDDETEDDDDELDFAQGIDSELDDDIVTEGPDPLSGGGFAADFSDDEIDDDSDDMFDDDDEY
ncbi:MAG: hypothetical protein GY794_10335 [bacterium]|nr:hypothetical protein [bacterium]